MVAIFTHILYEFLVVPYFSLTLLTEWRSHLIQRSSSLIGWDGREKVILFLGNLQGILENYRVADSLAGWKRIGTVVNVVATRFRKQPGYLNC